MTLDYFYGQSGELFSYFRIPKALFQDHRFRQLSTDARTLYGILLDRMSLSAKNGWLDEQGRVYIIYTVREVQESLCCAEHKAVKLFRELEGIDLIERKRRGLGRPSLIYVKDFSSGLPKAQVQNCPNSNSGAAESAILVQPKPQANKTDKNKTEWNDPDPIYSEGIREQLEDYFYQSLEVNLLLRPARTRRTPSTRSWTACGHLFHQTQAAAGGRGRQACGGRAQPIHEAECRPYPLCAEMSCGKYRTGTEYEAVSAGCTLQCTHDHSIMSSGVPSVEWITAG